MLVKSQKQPPPPYVGEKSKTAPPMLVKSQKQPPYDVEISSISSISSPSFCPSNSYVGPRAKVNMFLDSPE